MRTDLLGGKSAAMFLARYWQKKPLLVRRAFPAFKDLLSPDELAGLAVKGGVPGPVHARLVMEKGGKRPWQVEHGPFPEKRLRSLGKSHWTLLVANAETWVDGAAELLDQFAFIPGWRLDDLMISFAPPHGTVGPHVDSYDVFLIQGQGTRRWSIELKPDVAFRSGLDLKILQQFRADKEWVLEPGDMLYLPPGVAHFGVALTDCMTYSVGFRAPAQRHLLDQFYNIPDALLGAFGEDRLYADPGLKLQDSPGLITSQAVARVAELLKEPLKQPLILGRWFAAYTTRPSSGVLAGAAELSWDWRLPTPAQRQKTLAWLAKSQNCRRADVLRMAYLSPHKIPGTGPKAPTKAFYFYLAGEETLLPVDLLPLIKALCARRLLRAELIRAALPKAGPARALALDLLYNLIRCGILTSA